MTRRLGLAAAFLLCFAGSAPADGGRFTLEQVLSAPFPSGLVAAPTGGAVVWVFNTRGARNIWAAAPPENRARALTAFPADDGQEIDDCQFAPDGTGIVFVRGGGANRKGEFPNPSSSPEGARQEIFLVSLSGGAPKRLAEGHSPAVSPKGDRIAYVFKDQVWFVPLSGEGKSARAFEARGQATHLRWSPDGARLAFVSRREEHGFIGVYDPAGPSLSYLDPSTDDDSNPIWSPDGRRVLFLREPSSREARIFRPHREGQPWSLRVADVGSGVGREIFRAAPGRGSVYREIVATDQLFWTEGDRVVFAWERDGWTHLYSLPISGGDPTLLTPGEFEIEDASLSADRRRLLYNSNQDDIDRRHLWSVAAQGGKPTPLTSGRGIEWEPVETSDGKAVAYFRSDVRTHPEPVLQPRGSSARALAAETVPPEFPRSALVEPQPVLFSATDGVTIHGQLFLPPDSKKGDRHPAVLFFHGGSRRQMLLGWHYNYYYRNAYAFNQYLANHGYLVLSVNYRSGIGYGMEFREALDYGATGASEYRDVEGAGLFLKGRPDVDPARIGLWGGSYGGYLTALGLARASDLFAAGVDFHGVHDWNAEIPNFEPSYVAEKHEALARLAYESSPIASVQTWRSPVLLIHGDDDRNVPFAQDVELVEALRTQKVPFEELIFPDEIHDFLEHRHWLAAYHAAADFFDRHLPGGSAKR